MSNFFSVKPFRLKRPCEMSNLFLRQTISAIQYIRKLISKFLRVSLKPNLYLKVLRNNFEFTYENLDATLIFTSYFSHSVLAHLSVYTALYNNPHLSTTFFLARGGASTQPVQR